MQVFVGIQPPVGHDNQSLELVVLLDALDDGQHRAELSGAAREQLVVNRNAVLIHD